MITDKIFEETLNVFINGLEKYDEAIFRRKENPDTWSLAQLYAHLVISNDWYFEQIESCFGHQMNLDKEMSENAKIMHQRNSYLEEKLKWDLPDPENDLISINVVEEDLKNNLERSKTLWNSINCETIFGKVEHPAFGYMFPIEWYQFTEMHLRHHINQKNKIEDKYLYQRPSRG